MNSSDTPFFRVLPIVHPKERCQCLRRVDDLLGLPLQPVL
jgi:hypothetical protein